MAKNDDDKNKNTRKPWEESDERKKALESITDEDERKEADAWDRADSSKARIRKAREEYEKASAPKPKKPDWGRGGDD